jgi:hypothetical protein
MLKTQYIQYINLPVIPEDIVNSLPQSMNLYDLQCQGNYNWSDSFNDKLNQWAQKNICNEMYFAFQFITGDLPIHKDIGTQTKFVYIIETGGPNVITKFWDDDYNLLDEYCIEKNRWHILKADTNHSVEGIKNGNLRWSVTARIF